MPVRSDASRLIEAAEAGDQYAADQLLPLVYDELKILAASYLARERCGQTLQPTALVHEVYLRLVGSDDSPAWKGRGHFFGAAALGMRRILVEVARRKNSLKRNCGGTREQLDEIDLIAPEPKEDILELDLALSKLAEVDQSAANLVQLRYFAGLTIEAAANVMGISPRTAGRLWTFSRAWLREEVEGEDRNHGQFLSEVAELPDRFRTDG
ncbi:ECF-type sigma factor [Zavarzinella formosa]|uniref:ECF-type sigma factor n=1 Tax=Zavarzinella formosa TaxID=360055 RepID=UPI000380DBDB|nr:ECF-type sigma factor [Zavarzinella formosa]